VADSRGLLARGLLSGLLLVRVGSGTLAGGADAGTAGCAVAVLGSGATFVG
jgi:hypothetical protein